MSIHPYQLVACLFGLIAIFGTVFWIWTIVDCAKNEPENSNDKLVWILVVVLLGFLGAIIYFIARRPTRKSTFGR